jgi:hypothetical protein
VTDGDRLDVVPLLPDEGEQLVQDARLVVGECQDRVLMSENREPAGIMGRIISSMSVTISTR